MAKKMHFVSVAGVALCGAKAPAERITNKPELVTCSFCRRYNLKARVAGGCAPEPVKG